MDSTRDRCTLLRKDRNSKGRDGIISEISVYAHTDVKPPYIYTVEYREKWSGFLENAETDDKEEEA